MIGYEPGFWPVSYAGSECSVFDDTDATAPDQAQYEEMAAELLWNWTGRKFGVNAVTLRPQRREHTTIGSASSFEGAGPVAVAPGYGSGRHTGYTSGGNGWMPVVAHGSWWGSRCMLCDSVYGCSCGADSRKAIELLGPVDSIRKVTIDGEVLAGDQYWLRDGRWLIRIDGLWPAEQDMLLPEGRVGTWSIEYDRGIAVPPGGQIAAGVLACELAKAAQGDPECGLPKRLQTMSREGVTVGVLDPFEAATAHTWNINEIPKITTGIWTIDSWVAGVTVPRQSASVRSVDTPRSGRLIR
jgi:hypothetical protein